MSKVWLCMPSKRPVKEANHVLAEWYKHGYKIALQRDASDNDDPDVHNLIADELYFRPYKGYPEATNWLIKRVMRWSTEAEWFVLAGDDTLPDPNKSANEIAQECCHHFRLMAIKECLAGRGPDLSGYDLDKLSTFGVMQPTGDRWADSQGVCIERIAGSPWIGREFARRINGGRGPSWHEYFHMFNDEELQTVAIKYCVFWQRPDITHLHQHWCRPRPGEKMGRADRRPAFLDKANSPEEWKRSKAIFEARKVAGFPGSEPIP